MSPQQPVFSKPVDILKSMLIRNKTPIRLHDDLWFNKKGQLNDGPACKCSLNARKTGIRHGIFPGEEPISQPCDPNTSNQDKLYHYRIEVSPKTNFTFKNPTTIDSNGHLYKFDGFSILSHIKLVDLPPIKMIRFNIEYTIKLIEEKYPPPFRMDELELFKRYLFNEILELYDLDWKTYNDKNGCQRFHLYPRFVKKTLENQQRNSENDSIGANEPELLSIEAILDYIVSETKSLAEEIRLYGEDHLSDYKVRYKETIVWAPNCRPSALRIDQIDYEKGQPVIVHFSLRPPHLSYANSPHYQKAWKELLKFRHLLANKPKVTLSEKQTLAQKEAKVQEYKSEAKLKKDTILLPLDKFYTTGLLCDVVQYAMIMPVMIYQIRFQHSLGHLENLIEHKFKDKYLLQLALTHPSYRENYGTNADHARNTLNNLGFRQSTYGDSRINYQTRKRGINTLFNIMSRFGCHEETMSNIQHNERLEFLGDAVVEFLTSIHLYFMFPDLEEGGLATYRAALVQNQHLAILAKKLELDRFMLYAHGSDLCHDSELSHAMANCFEALMAALFLDAGLETADKVLAKVLFDDNEELLNKWVNYPKHKLQSQDPDGDRDWIEKTPLLQKLVEFEQKTGITFNNVRLLARAFTHRSIGYNLLTLGTNQRMEFLGDTVLQLIASEYLYKHFPGHHEGHLSLLRSSLVNNRTQTVVCDDLGMSDYLNHRTKGPLRSKDRADLLEAFIGALYVDSGLEKCQTFCSVCFFPRLEDFIMNQSWNDPKSKLQQCCLTLRSLESREPDIPVYKVIDTIGPTNTRVYNVAVYFKDQRLANGSGSSIQVAEMAAATKALESFPMERQKRRTDEPLKYRSTIPVTNKRFKPDVPQSGAHERSPTPSGSNNAICDHRETMFYDDYKLEPTHRDTRYSYENSNRFDYDPRHVMHQLPPPLPPLHPQSQHIHQPHYPIRPDLYDAPRAYNYGYMNGGGPRPYRYQEFPPQYSVGYDPARYNYSCNYDYEID